MQHRLGGAARIAGHRGPPDSGRLEKDRAKSLRVESAPPRAARHRKHIAGREAGGKIGLRHRPRKYHMIGHGGESVVARLDLTGERDLLTILSGRERTVRLLDEIRAERGDNPADSIPRLLEVA